VGSTGYYTWRSSALGSQGMLNLDYDALEQGPVAHDPFTHVLIPNFVPAPDLGAVVEGLPQFSRGGSFPIDSLRLGGVANELVASLEGARFRKAVENRFGLDLGAAATMVTLRGQSREKDGRIHCDSTAKQVTVLLYLNPRSASWSRQEGCLRLLRGPSDLEDYAVEVPPVDGTLLVFPNGPTTWHGHRQFVGRRYVIQMNYMANDAAAQSELRRHRLSAMVKRLIAA
jgi:SM-20-related protein